MLEWGVRRVGRVGRVITSDKWALCPNALPRLSVVLRPGGVSRGLPLWPVGVTGLLLRLANISSFRLWLPGVTARGIKLLGVRGLLGVVGRLLGALGVGVRLLELLGVCARLITREVGLLLRSGNTEPLAERPPGDCGREVWLGSGWAPWWRVVRCRLLWGLLGLLDNFPSVSLARSRSTSVVKKTESTLIILPHLPTHSCLSLAVNIQRPCSS